LVAFPLAAGWEGWEAGLPDDGLQSPNPNFNVVGYRQSFLHHDMASPPAHFFKAMPRQNCTDLLILSLIKRRLSLRYKHLATQPLLNFLS